MKLHGNVKVLYDEGDITDMVYNVGRVEYIDMYNEEKGWRFLVRGEFEGYSD